RALFRSPADEQRVGIVGDGMGYDAARYNGPVQIQCLRVGVVVKSERDVMETWSWRPGVGQIRAKTAAGAGDRPELSRVIVVQDCVRIQRPVAARFSNNCTSASGAP